MPSETSWYQEKRVILTQYSGSISRDDFVASTESVGELIEQGVPPVHWLIDTSQIDKPFLDLGTMRKMLECLKHPHFGWALLYGGQANRGINFLATAVGQLSGVRYRIVDSQAQALAVLKEKDHTLNGELETKP